MKSENLTFFQLSPMIVLLNPLPMLSPSLLVCVAEITGIPKIRDNVRNSCVILIYFKII